MCGTLKIDLFIYYNFCCEYFFPISLFIDIKRENLLNKFFLVLALTIKFARIFIIIFVISAIKYVGIIFRKFIPAASAINI